MKASFAILTLAFVILATSGCSSSLPQNQTVFYGPPVSAVQDEYRTLSEHAANVSPEPELKYRYYEFELPEHEVDGVIIDRHHRVIEVVE